MAGRSIRIFLVDGIASGLRTAELGLSTIKALVVPRASLSAATKRPEVQRTGIYILIGRDSDKPGVPKIYFGEGDTILTRLSAHDKDPEMDFWDEAVVFVSKDDNLTKAHGRFLESRLIAFARQAKRCIVTHATEPPDQQDYAFTSMSAAATVVSGHSINGRNAWKLKDASMTFAEWQDAQLPMRQTTLN